MNGKVLYVDIDQDFKLFLKSRTWDYIKENWTYVIDIFLKYEGNENLDILPPPWTLSYRKSSSGNVHLKLVVPSEMSVLDQFKVRALLHDDPWRMGIDLRRLAIQGEEEINRIFEMKVKNGIVYKVGPWIDISEMMTQ